MDTRGEQLSGSLAELLRLVRYEVIPLAATEDEVLEFVPKDVTVTITASPTKGLDATLGLAERLAARGFRVVPHNLSSARFKPVSSTSCKTILI